VRTATAGNVASSVGDDDSSHQLSGDAVDGSLGAFIAVEVDAERSATD
jgi:hypothetical protein